MKNILLCFSLLLVGPYQVERFDYEEERKEAIHFIDLNKTLIDEITQKYGLEAKVVLPIIFPELIRYSLLRDYIETKALEAIYVNDGKEGADFSIGYFQMKPSFAEKIENYTRGKPTISGHFKWMSDNTMTIKQARKKRLQHLSSLEGQLHYACVFVLMMKERFATEQFESQATRIQLYAAAYNYGLDSPLDELQKWIPVEAFPFGLKYNTKQYAYADLAVKYYSTVGFSRQ